VPFFDILLYLRLKSTITKTVRLISNIWRIATTAILISILMGCGGAGRDRPLTEYELKQQLLASECMYPENHITGKVHREPIYKNLLSMKVIGLKLKFEIINKATMAVFKDLTVNVKFTAKTGGVVIQKDITIHEYFAPGQLVNFRYDLDISNQQYKDIDAFSWSIKTAQCK
jgi:hypothetical protein